MFLKSDYRLMFENTTNMARVLLQRARRHDDMAKSAGDGITVHEWRVSARESRTAAARLLIDAYEWKRYMK